MKNKPNQRRHGSFPGLGIGANTAILSVASALFLKPLPYRDPDRLAVLWLRSPGIGIPLDSPSPGQYIDIFHENHSFSEIAISQGGNLTLTGLENPERIDGLRTSSNLFHILGAKPLYGRLLLPEDDQPGKPAVAVLSHDIWQRLFHSDPNIVGQSINLSGKPYTVAGVLTPEFRLNHEVMRRLLPNHADPPAEGPLLLHPRHAGFAESGDRGREVRRALLAA